MAIQLAGNTVIHDNQNVQVSGVTTASSFVGDGSQLTNLPASGGTLEATASGTLVDGDPVVVNTDGTVSAVEQVGSAWIASLGGRGVAVDSSGNVYVCGYNNSIGQGSQEMYLAKYNSSGVIQWQRSLGGTSGDYGYGIALDSSGGVYIGGITSSAGQGSNDMMIAKYNSSGVIQWQRALGTSGNDQGLYVATDSSNNVYLCGTSATSGAGMEELIIAKYNSSGTIQWQRRLGGSANDVAYGVATDSSDNVYVCGSTRSNSSNDDAVIAKYNSSGTIQWQRVLYSSVQSDLARRITTDSSGNVYICGRTSSIGQGNGDLLIAKYNTSGTIQWQRILGGNGGEYGYGVAVDSSGDVYVGGTTSSIVDNDILIAKYNSSGVIQWQRYLTYDWDTLYDLKIDDSGSLYITGGLVTAKLPTDGSLTGTYGSYTYAAASLTEAASTLTSSSSSLTAGTSYLSDQSISLTDASSNLTSTITSLTPSNLTAENFIGISDASYTNGQTATIQISGSIDDAQSGLTPGQKYYVQNDGTLSETADSPSVLAGTAVASTKLLINS